MNGDERVAQIEARLQAAIDAKAAHNWSYAGSSCVCGVMYYEAPNHQVEVIVAALDAFDSGHPSPELRAAVRRAETAEAALQEIEDYLQMGPEVVAKRSTP